MSTMLCYSGSLINLMLNRGYTMLEANPIEDPEGVEGYELLFEVLWHGQPYRYLAKVYVLDGPFWSSQDTIRVVEFVAPDQSFDRYAASLQASGARPNEDARTVELAPVEPLADHATPNASGTAPGNHGLQFLSGN